MKSILIIVACVIGLPFGLLRASELSDIFDSRDYTCSKCDAKIKHVCPACHGHLMIDPFGKSNRDGHYTRVCSVCAEKSDMCCYPKQTK